MRPHDLRTFLAAVVLAAVAGRGLGQDEQCVAELQAPEGSPWKNLGGSREEVSLRQLQQQVEKHGLTLVEGPPPPSAPQSLVAVTCERLGQMWVGLPDPAASLEDEEARPLACRLAKVRDTISSFLGFKKDSPKQYPGQPRRVYMKDYCGVKFPVTSKSQVAKRMHANTRRLEKKMNSWKDQDLAGKALRP